MAKLVRRVKKDTIPVVVLAGFLGSGKTTILNYILRAAVGVRIAVIVNDFGSVNIDALLITAQSDQKLELTNGCICCSMDGGDLEEVLEMALGSDPEVIVIEASGIAEPYDIARMIILSPNQQIGYGGLVYVVDGMNYDQVVGRHPRLIDHVQLADLVVVSKAEYIEKGLVDRRIKELSAHTTSPVVAVRHGALAPELLFDMPQYHDMQVSLLQQHDAYKHLHDEYHSVVFETNKPLDFRAFKNFMNNLPSGIYRIKGIVYFGMAGYEQKFVVQSVGGRWDMYGEEWSDEEVPQTTLVVIGTEFNEEKLMNQLNDIIGESEYMLDIRRYIGEP